MNFNAMVDEKFWDIIESIPSSIEDPDERVEYLRSILEPLSTRELISFEITFRNKINQAYSWDLWGAAYVIHGGCSDDGFEYFRRWLVSRGREVYQRALLNPETLADLDIHPAGPEGYWEFEEIYYVTMDVFAAKGGDGDVRDYAEPEAGLGSGTPTGEPFLEDEDSLSQRYPKLWQRFGNSPLPME